MRQALPNLTPDWTGRILIIKPSSLGDIVHALPVLSALRQACPRAHITWMIRPELASILDCVKGVDEILFFDRRKLSRCFTGAGFSELRAFVKKLRQGRYDLVLDLQGLLRSGLFARITGCPLRIGLAEAREGATLFYTHTVAAPSSPHIVDYYKEALTLIGLPADPVHCAINPPQSARRQVEELLHKQRITPKKFVVLIPGSAHRSKCWPTEHFARLAEYLLKETNLYVVAAGSNNENAVIDEITNASAAPILSLAGRTTLPQLAALFEQAALVVGNDTGPTHIAVAMNIPTVTIFGPTNPARLGPYRKPECIAAVNPFGRGRAVDTPDPKYKIEYVTLEMVLEKAKPLLASGRK